MIKASKYWLCFLIYLPTITYSLSAITFFGTGGHTIYHLKTGTVDLSGKRVILGAAYDGYLVYRYHTGEPLWRQETNGQFPFDLGVSDIDVDGGNGVVGGNLALPATGIITIAGTNTSYSNKTS